MYFHATLQNEAIPCRFQVGKIGENDLLKSELALLRARASVEDARFSALQLQQTQRNVVIAAKSDTVAEKQFEVARNRYTVSKISNTDLYSAQSEKDAAVIA